MTVKITKPSINIREKLSELDKPVGVAGQAMLRAETPQEQQSLIGVGRKNLLINGSMQINQRGWTTGSAGVNQYLVDRWFSGSSTSSTSQYSVQSATLPNGRAVKTLKWQANSATTMWVDPYQGVEDYYLINNQVVTMSAWVRTNIPGCSFRQYSTANYGEAFPHDGNWHYVTATFKPPVTTTTRGVNSCYFSLSSGYSRNWAGGEFLEFTQVQLELGPVATPFEHRSYGEELALCQRYYQKHYVLGAGVQNSGTAALIACHLPVPMRALPSISTKSGVLTNINVENDDTYDVYNVSISHGIDGSSGDVEGSFIATVLTSGTNTVGNGVCVMCDRNDDWFTFTAEL